MTQHPGTTNHHDPSINNRPLVVDLDGTLIYTDMLHESALIILRDKPHHLLAIPYWLMRANGKAVLKQRLAHLIDVDVTVLPYNLHLLDWLKQQKAQGRKLILCTASDIKIAQLVANHLNIFDAVIASDGKNNLAGKHKAEMLINQFGYEQFDYVGNSSADLAVWKAAKQGVVVNASKSVTQKSYALCEVTHIFPPTPLNWSIGAKVLRLHQWLKNLLLFVPIFAAHQLTDVHIWWSLVYAFLSFSLCASAVYIANDLLDLESDRKHVRKSKRPFASGRVSIRSALILTPILLFASFSLAQHVGGNFLPWLAAYFVLTCAYSWGLKRLMLIDCITLAMLYTLRVIAGTAAVGLTLSFWLLAFSIFLFLSLAFIKRYAELELQLLSGTHKTHGRGYYTSDAGLIQTLGVSSGYAAILVLALYLNSDAILVIYQTPEFVWGAIPIMLFWISWMWMQAHRGKMHDDPVIFAITHKASILAGIGFAAMFVMGGVSW